MTGLISNQLEVMFSKCKTNHIPVPICRFAHLHVDLVGPLPSSCTYTYLFTVVDRTSRWPEAVPLTGTTAAECAAALFSGWIQRFGVPETLTSDRGTQFTSSLWAALCRLLDISHRPTTAYHPQSNGMVERFHRRLKDALRARCAAADWHAHLPWVMLGIRAAWRMDGSYSPAEAVFGAQPVLPGQYLAQAEPPAAPFLDDLQEVLSSRQPRSTSHHSQPGPPELPQAAPLVHGALDLCVSACHVTNCILFIENAQNTVPSPAALPRPGDRVESSDNISIAS